MFLFSSYPTLSIVIQYWFVVRSLLAYESVWSSFQLFFVCDLIWILGIVRFLVQLMLYYTRYFIILLILLHKYLSSFHPPLSIISSTTLNSVGLNICTFVWCVIYVFRVTNDDGRAGQFLSQEEFTQGTYKMFFDTGDYFKQLNIKGFYPHVEVGCLNWSC